LLGQGIDPRTVNDGDLSALKSVFEWARKTKRIPFNPAQGVRVPEGKKVRVRERGFNDDEAATILKASLAYQKTPNESVEVAAAKKWAPWLCAFTGARVGEIVQLHRKHIAQTKEGHWEVRITPADGGAVKTKTFRHVPVHPQLIELGFVEFVQSRSEGPLFQRPGKATGGRGGVQNRLQEFVRALVPDRNVQPNVKYRGAVDLAPFKCETVTRSSFMQGCPHMSGGISRVTSASPCCAA
jgi:integrase